MKRFFLGFICLALLVTTTAFNSTNQDDYNKLDTSTYKIMEATYLWNLLSDGFEPVRERDDTWLLEGFRSKYAMAKRYTSLSMVEKAFGCSVFVKGPHEGDMDFNSTSSFGYYNPEFVEKLTQSTLVAMTTPMFKKVVKQTYEQHFKDMAITYRDAYYHITEKPHMVEEIQKNYLLEMAQPGGTSEGSLQEIFREYADAQEKSNTNVSWYEAVTAPSFWIRRSIDGSADSLFKLLNFIIDEMQDA